MESKNNKIAIIADIHSNYMLLQKVIRDIETRGINEICFLGDYVTDGFDNNAVVDLVKQYEYVIAGNRDISVANYNGISWEHSEQFKNMLYAYNDLSEENREYLKGLPKYRIITINNKKICLTHGTPDESREIVKNNSYEVFDRLIEKFNCDIYLLAHMHEAYCTNYKDRTFINPGSVFLPADGPCIKYGILDLETMEYESIEIDYEFEEVKNYYLNSDYYLKNREWCNILLYNNKMGIDYVCMFIEFIQEKAKNENIDITNGISNELWHDAFLDFMKEKGFEIY